MEGSTLVTGAIEPEEKLEALADADVFVSSSEAENFGFSVFEAMASRVPVVVSETIDYAGQIADAGAGFVVPRKTQSFTDAIVRLLEDPALRKAKGMNGMRLAEAYSLAHTASKLERTIHSIVNSRPLDADLTNPVSLRG